MSTRRTGRRGRFASFVDDAPPLSQTRMPEAGRLVMEVTLRGDTREVDSSGWPCPRLTRRINELLAEYRSERDLRWKTFHGTRNSLRKFVELIDRVTGPDTDLGGIEAAHLDLFEKELLAGDQRTGDPKQDEDAAGGRRTKRKGRRLTNPESVAATRMAHVIGVLRQLHHAAPDALDDKLVERLKYVRLEHRRVDTPLDAYPPEVFEAFKNAAMADIRAIQRRIQAGEELMRTGQDPRPILIREGRRRISGWRQIENALWFIDQYGPDGLTRITSKIRTEWGGVMALCERLYLTSGDVTAFLVLLACLTGMEPECLRRLDRDCLSSPARGFVTISYVKYRAGSEKVTQTMRVSDGGGLHQPGGVIRLLLRLTERAHRHTGLNDLWLVSSYRGLHPAFGTNASHHGWVHTQAWLQRHGLDQLTDSNGQKVRLDLRRLGKTFKSQQYLKSAGVLSDFAQGHSKDVAAKHYADIPIHADVHDLAVENGLREALAVALPDPVVLDDDGTVLSSQEELPPEEVGKALSGQSDVFLASCRDFHDTPFADKGKPCPVPLWGCVECPNAIFTTRHLPQLLAFMDFIEGQREELPAAEWMLRYATAWERIVRGVRAKFRPDQIATAQAIAESGGARLVLPPEFFEGIA